MLSGEDENKLERDDPVTLNLYIYQNTERATTEKITGSLEV